MVASVGQHEGKTFRLTKEGSAIWAARGRVALPLDHRRVLGVVEYGGHIDVIRSQLARFPFRQVEEWIAEFLAMRLIEPAPKQPPVKLADLARDSATAPIEPEDAAEFESLCSQVDNSLSRLGVYIASERAQWLPSSGKKVYETRVLVVEDDPDQVVVALRRLKAARYQGQAVGTVAALYEFLEQERPDAILLDINLPDGSGFEVLQTLRRHPSYAFLPVAMLTSRSALQDIVKGLLLGADAYVTKAYGPNTFDYVLRYVLRQEITSARGVAAH
jgi:CheY-like chemotaxis protein